jgi:nucleoside-diphosphate-sugar epimerase
MASPVSLSFTDPDPVIRTAVNGTVTVLQSALEKAGSQLKAFILTSSIAAVRSPYDPPHIYTEEEWNTWAEATVAEKGKDTPGPAIYSASKTASERAFWDFGKSKHPPFTLTAINPG